MARELSRRSFLKGAAGAAAGVAVMGVLGAAGAAEPAASGGVKTASAAMPGFGGDITVTLSVDTGSGLIVDCSIVGEHETEGIGKRAVAEMPGRYIEAGSLEVDGISGATTSSTAIKNAASVAYNSIMGLEAGPVRMAPGQYTASAMGYWGIWELPVTITVSETALLKIEVPEDRFAHGETEVLLENVKELLFPRMIENQSLTVDSIAGATVSSNAVKISVEKALKEALAAGGSDPSAIEHFYKAPEKPYAGVTEELDTDLLIVGMSNGGIIAFVNAMEQMQKLNGNKLVSILAIDKAGKYGGKSCLTHEFNAVNPSEYSKLYNNGENYVDADYFKGQWLEFTTDKEGVQRAKEEMIDLYFSESGRVIDFLHAHGWRFGTQTFSDMAQGSVAFNSVLSSNVDTGTYEDRRAGVEKYYRALLSSVVAQGGEYMLETEAYDFIMDGDRVAGVKARNSVSGKEYNIHARAVIMSTGGFGANDEMMSSLIDPRYAGPRKRLGTDMDDGKLVKAALDIGAGTWNIEMSPNVMHVGLDHYLTHYPINFKEGQLNGRTGRPNTWTLNDIPLGMSLCADGITVDPQGRRFCNERALIQFAKDIYSDSWCAFAAGTHYYSIYSREQMDVLAENGFTTIPKWEGYCAQGGVPAATPLPEIYECMELCVADGLAWKDDTLEGLAAQLGMDPAALADTVATYNGYVDAGEDADFQKEPEYLTQKVGAGPYYAIKLQNVIFGTCGGLDVDREIRVLREDHQTPIPGLYACGSDSMGVLLSPEHNYVGFGGVAQGWLAVSGLIAAESAVRYVAENFGLSEVSPALVDLEAISSARYQ